MPLRWLRRVVDVVRVRQRRRRPLAIPVNRPPDPKTLDEVGRERLLTHVRTRNDLF